MKQKYCPYCDQKMTSGLYCSGCKRIVWHPYVQDVDYYLNERHPQHESDCLYHDGGSEYPGSSTSGTDSYAGIFKGNGTSTRIQGGKKKTNREKKTADPFQNMGNRMTGQWNAFEHMKSQLEQYRSQADTCQSGTYSSQSAKNIMDRVNSERGRKKPFTGIHLAGIFRRRKPAVSYHPCDPGIDLRDREHLRLVQWRSLVLCRFQRRGGPWRGRALRRGGAGHRNKLYKLRSL